MTPRPVPKGKEYKWTAPKARGGHALSIRFTDEARGERFFDTKFAMVPVGPNTIYIHRSVTPYGGFGRTAMEYGLDKQIRKGELLDLVHSWDGRHGLR